MPYIASSALGAVAGILALGAVHLEVASGNDLLGPAQRGDASLAVSANAAGDALSMNINRSAKGDRDTNVQPAGGTTLSFMMPGATDVSIMVRLPSSDAAEAVRKPFASTIGVSKGSSDGKRTVACEPVVSVLTAVAKQLQPGRCVT